MGLREDHGDRIFSEHSYDDDFEDMTQKKRVKRLLDEQIERKRLREEFKDDFDELSGEFDWDEIEK